MTATSSPIINKEKRTHTLNIAEKTTITGAVSIEEYNDKQATIKLSQGILVLNGENLNVEKLNLETGDVVFSGIIVEVKYLKSREKLSIIKKLFK